jgi:hypothetical protein
LFQRHPFPLRRSLHDLRSEGMFVAVIGNVKLDGRARSVTVEHVIDAALGVHNQWNLDHHQAEFLA